MVFTMKNNTAMEDNKCYCPTVDQDSFCWPCIKEMMDRGDCHSLGRAGIAYRFEGTSGPWFVSDETPRPEEECEEWGQ